MNIQNANIEDAKALTELTMSSKSYWNYGEKQIEEWRVELTISKKYLEEYQVYKLTKNSKILGYYSYKAESNVIVKLDNLFIKPEYIGQGYGKILLYDFLDRAKKAGYSKAVLDSDPNAEKFYKRFGFQVVGKLKSSIKDRDLPIMEKEIQ